MSLIPAKVSLKFIRGKNFQGEYEGECAICYKKINKTAFVCSDPCNKVFHPACLEETFKRHEETAETDEIAAQQRCCYCRRYVNIEHYELSLFAHTLRSLRDSNCFDVHEALCLVKYRIIHTTHCSDDDAGYKEDDNDYSIYFPKNQTNQAPRPKQSKRSIYKTIPNRPIGRAAVRKNYGARR